MIDISAYVADTAHMKTNMKLYFDSKRHAEAYAHDAQNLWGGNWTSGQDEKGWFAVEAAK
jgi:hypothetical protein